MSRGPAVRVPRLRSHFGKIEQPCIRKDPGPDLPHDTGKAPHGPCRGDRTLPWGSFWCLQEKDRQLSLLPIGAPGGPLPTPWGTSTSFSITSWPSSANCQCRSPRTRQTLPKAPSPRRATSPGGTVAPGQMSSRASYSTARGTTSELHGCHAVCPQGLVETSR